jgi:Rod binding domain-containing protein
MTLPIAGFNALREVGHAQAEPPIDPKALKAAKDFEAIFLRTLLSSLEKTTSMSGGASKPSTGASTYGSMVVGALADNISSSGGIGLAAIVAKSLSAHVPAAATEPKPTK